MYSNSIGTTCIIHYLLKFILYWKAFMKLSCNQVIVLLNWAELMVFHQKSIDGINKGDTRWHLRQWNPSSAPARDMKLPWTEGSEDPVSEVLPALLLWKRQNQITVITIPTNATAPAAPPKIAARIVDIWFGSHFSYGVEYLDLYGYTWNLKLKGFVSRWVSKRSLTWINKGSINNSWQTLLFNCKQKKSY